MSDNLFAVPESVPHNLLRLNLDRPLVPDPSHLTQIPPGRLAEWAARFNITLNELTTPPRQLADDLRARIHEASALPLEESAAALQHVRDRAHRLGFTVLAGEAELALAEAHRRSGHTDESVAAGLAALGSPLTNDVTRRAEVILFLGRVLQDSGQLGLAESLYESAIRLIPAGSRAHVAALVNYGTTLGVSGNPVHARTVYEQAAEWADKLALHDLRAWALAGIAASCAAADQPVEARRAIRQGLAFAKAHGLQEVVGLLTATRLWIKAMEHPKALDAISDASWDFPWSRAEALDTFAMRSYYAKQFEECLAYADKGLASLATMVVPRFHLKVRLLWWRALSSHALGRPEAALYREWADDLRRATLSNRSIEGLPAWPEDR